VAVIMFVVPPFYGHITATLGVGAELIARGHRVCWVAMKEIAEGYIPQGGEWIVPEDLAIYRDEIDQILLNQNVGTKISGLEALDFGLNETMLPFARIMMTAMQSLVDTIQPDCIVHDESALAGAIAAVKNNIPYVTSITSPPGFFDPNLFFPERQKQLLETMAGVQRDFGITSGKNIFNSDKLILSYTSRELLKPNYGDFVFDGPVEFVGAIIESRPEPTTFNWNSLPNTEWPTIYVSIGTVLDDIRTTIFGKIIAALGDQPINVIANTSPAIFEQWPSNFVVQSVCPQLDIIKNVDLVITHGGFNTINESLFFNKPLIVLPLAWDQSPNANLVVQNGCGLKFRYKRLVANDFAAAVFEALSSSELKANAARLGESLRSLGGTHRAASLIEKIIA
jgi:MGT family glycosyltransferase